MPVIACAQTEPAVVAVLPVSPSATPAFAAPASLADARNAASANVPELTLEEAITLVLKNNPQREQAAAALAAARARIGTARSAGGLQVGLSGNANLDRSFGQGDSFNFSSLGGGLGGGTSTGLNFGSGSGEGWEHSERLGATATYPLYKGGKVKASTRAAEAQTRAQAAQTLQIEQDLVLSTINNYVNILRTGQLLDVAESNLVVSREQRRVAQVRYDAGAAARLDVYRADATLADAEHRRIAAGNTLAQAKANLNTLLARAPETPVRVAPVTSLALKLPLPGSANLFQADAPLAAASSELRTIADQARPSIAVNQAQVDAAAANVDVAKAGRKPSLDFNLSGFLSNPASFLGRFALSLGLSVAQTLFDSGRTRSQVNEANALLDQYRQGLSGEKLRVANLIEQALLTYDSARKRQASADAGVTAAAEAVRATQIGYQAGARTGLEVTDAQAALIAAQTDAVNARFDVVAAQGSLAAAVGVFTDEGRAAYQRALHDEEEALRKAQPVKSKITETKRKK